jgi:molybdopterin converting factor subunit 1
MNVKVLFFATMRERTGIRETILDVPDGMAVVEFKNLLVVRYPGLDTAMSSVLIAVNKEFAFDDQIIPDHAEVAVFPPVSGG